MPKKHDGPAPEEALNLIESQASALIHEIVEEDLARGVHGGRVHTRFPPEPNGYLHIGHAKSKLVLTTFPENASYEVQSPNHPEYPALGNRRLQLCRELYIEREDFTETPAKQWHRLAPGREVRLWSGERQFPRDTGWRSCGRRDCAATCRRIVSARAPGLLLHRQ